MMFTAFKAWLAQEPAIVWTAFSNAVLAGTIWGALPAFGIHIPAPDQPMIVVAVNAINAFIVRTKVTPNANVVEASKPLAPSVNQGTAQ